MTQPTELSRREPPRPFDHWRPFACDVIGQHDGTVLVRPAGELDLATADELDRRVRQATEEGARKVVIDLGALTFIDSTGLRLLLRWQAAAASDGFELGVLPGPPHVQRIFSIAGLEDHLPFR